MSKTTTITVREDKLVEFSVTLVDGVETERTITHLGDPMPINHAVRGAATYIYSYFNEDHLEVTDEVLTGDDASVGSAHKGKSINTLENDNRIIKPTATHGGGTVEIDPQPQEISLVVGQRSVTVQYVDGVPTITNFQDGGIGEDFPNFDLQHGDFVVKWAQSDREPTLVVETVPNPEG